MKLLARLTIALSLLVSLAAGAQQSDVKVIALFANKAMLQVGNKNKVVASGESFEGVMLKSADGRKAVVVIDGETLELGLNQSIGSSYKKRERSRITIAPDAQGMYFVAGTINGTPTRFLVDTGATHIAMSGRKADALNLSYRNGQQGKAQTASGVVDVWRIHLASVSIGAIKLHNVTAVVIAGNHPAQVLLGNSFLGRTDIQKAGAMLEITKRH